MILGIDFGAKKAGTTVIATLNDENKVDFFISEKNQDADQFINDVINSLDDVWSVYIDAPLSLPKTYSIPNYEGDFFYREADKLTGAMSPMFLGGLTARAMKIKRELVKKGIKVVETYPGKLAKVLQLNELEYKQDLEKLSILCEKVKGMSGFNFECSAVKTWHHFDAVLCLYSARRHEMQSAMVFGKEDEGTITV